MKAFFVKGYLCFVAIALSVTFVGKVPAVLRTMSDLFHMPDFMARDLCMETPLFGSLDPTWIHHNYQFLAIAAGIEFFIVMLICFCRVRWVPCLVSALWGTVCGAARVHFMMSGTDCGCLGWIAKVLLTAT